MEQQACSKDLHHAALDLKDILAMQALTPLSTTYLPWSISAMRPSGIVAILNEIMLNRRRCIVELGGGVSTYFIGRLLLRLGEGHAWTVEHDDRWADLLGQELLNAALSESVTIVRAGLKPTSSTWPNENSPWYDPDSISEAVAGQRIDLLVIDGPPAYQVGREHSRYPAIPFFKPLLADDFTIIVDDIHRSGEQDIVERWESQLGITFDQRAVDGGIGIGRAQAAFTV